MSREHTIYTITCQKCGHSGEVDRWSDDWNRSGFEIAGGFTWGRYKPPLALTFGGPLMLECPKCNHAGDVVQGERKFR
jgi:hypothetical protein